MKIAYRIALPEPCTEDWEQMKPNGCGRFCAACEKTVVDFTGYSDEAFISFFRKTKVIPCGRFTERQFSIVITPLPQPVFEFPKIGRYLAAGLLALAGIAGKAEAQSKLAVTTKTVSHNNPAGTKEWGPLLVKGVIKDEHGEGAAGASVSIKGFQEGTIADVDGIFTLELPLQADTWTLIFQWIGAKPDSLVINRNSFDEHLPITIMMKADTNVSVIISGPHIDPQSYTGGGVRVTAIQAMPGNNPGLTPSLKPSFWQRLSKPFRKKQRNRL